MDALSYHCPPNRTSKHAFIHTYLLAVQAWFLLAKHLQ
jgi:hypothetical protein